MKRRQFIASFSFGALSFGLFESKESLLSNGFEHDLFVPHELLKIIKDEQTIVEIGLSYRSMKIEENAEDILIDKLAGLTRKQGLISKESLGRSVVNDFESGNSIQVNGWILSRTEARQCALYSIWYA